MFCNSFSWHDERPKLKLTYNEKEAAGLLKWTAFSSYKDAIKLLADLSSSYFWQPAIKPAKHDGILTGAPEPPSLRTRFWPPT